MSKLLIIRIGLGVFYLIIWLVFGFLFRHEANSSSGKSFIFQEDIKLKHQVEVFKHNLNLSLPDNVIINLIKSDDVNKVAVMIKFDDSTTPYYPFIQVLKPFKKEIQYYYFNGVNIIGYNWASFYREKFKSEGISHFSVVNDKSQKSFSPKGTYNHKLLLYKGLGDGIIPTRDEDIKKLILVKEYSVWLTSKDFKYELDGVGKIDIFPLMEFERVMSYSVNLLDDSIYKLQDIMRGKYQYPLIDFLYFSAVTISTLGYGDILPNSQYIRVLVILETFLGILLIGAFISSIFYQRNEMTTNR